MSLIKSIVRIMGLLTMMTVSACSNNAQESGVNESGAGSRPLVTVEYCKQLFGDTAHLFQACVACVEERRYTSEGEVVQCMSAKAPAVTEDDSPLGANGTQFGPNKPEPFKPGPLPGETSISATQGPVVPYDPCSCDEYRAPLQASLGGSAVNSGLGGSTPTSAGFSHAMNRNYCQCLKMRDLSQECRGRVPGGMLQLCYNAYPGT